MPTGSPKSGSLKQGSVLNAEAIPEAKAFSQMQKALKTAGLRMTRARTVILRVLAAADDHPEAIDIFVRAQKLDRNVALSTVYRTLKTLEAQGSVHRHSFEGGTARYERAADKHHDHLINVETGEVVEFTSPEIELLQEEVARRLGFELVDHRLELYVRPLAKPS